MPQRQRIRRETQLRARENGCERLVRGAHVMEAKTDFRAVTEDPMVIGVVSESLLDCVNCAGDVSFGEGCYSDGHDGLEVRDLHRVSRSSFLQPVKQRE